MVCIKLFPLFQSKQWSEEDFLQVNKDHECSIWWARCNFIKAYASQN